jgi:sugar O-acyltransferase (sialic acid O-acetyltransferase NeuD family)
MLLEMDLIQPIWRKLVLVDAIDTEGEIVTNITKKIIIFGVTKFAEMLKFYIDTETTNKVAGFTVDREYIDSKYFNSNIPIKAFDEIDDIFPKEEYKILPVVGYNCMNRIREKVFNKIKEKGYEIDSFIHPTAYVASNCVMGEGNIILENTTIQPFVTIGSGNVFWSNCNISHHTKIGDYNFFAPASALAGNVEVAHHCFVGNNCTIKNGVTVMPYTLIGAGSYISANTQEYSVIVPNKSIILNDKRSIDIDLG